MLSENQFVVTVIPATRQVLASTAKHKESFNISGNTPAAGVEKTSLEPRTKGAQRITLIKQITTVTEEIGEVVLKQMVLVVCTCIFVLAISTIGSDK